MDVIRKIEQEYMKKDIPEFRPGDTIRVHYRTKEGDRERIHLMEGVVLKFSGKGPGRTVTIRKVSYGIGVEWIFPLHSPRVEKIEVLKRGKYRKAKLYFLRGNK